MVAAVLLYCVTVGNRPPYFNSCEMWHFCRLYSDPAPVSHFAAEPNPKSLKCSQAVQNCTVFRCIILQCCTLVQCIVVHYCRVVKCIALQNYSVVWCNVLQHCNVVWCIVLQLQYYRVAQSIVVQFSSVYCSALLSTVMYNWAFWSLV